jgi:hypothetical protein
MSFTRHKLGNIDSLADAAKSVVEGKINVYELAASLKDEDASDFITAAACAKREGKSHFMFNGKSYPVTIGDDVAKQIEAKLDPVDDDEVEKDFDDRDDKDIDNDGDTDDSDEYLHKKRQAIDKAIDDEEEVDEATEDKKQFSPKSNDEVAPGTDTGVESQDDVEVKDGEEEEAEKDSERKTVKTEGIQGLINNLVGITKEEEVVEEAELEEDIEESTAAYAKSLEKIANDRKMKNISKKDKETLIKIAQLMKSANETTNLDIEIDEGIVGDVKKKMAAKSLGRLQKDEEKLRAALKELEKPMFRSNDNRKRAGKEPLSYDEIVDRKEKIKDKIYRLKLQKLKLKDKYPNLKSEDVQESIELDEGRMKELHGYIEDGKTAEEIIKLMKLKKTPDMIKFIKGLMK